VDVIYTNAQREDMGVVPNFKMDLSFGMDENNFELSVSNTDHVCEDGSVIYMEGTEYGGIVDGIRVETENRKIIYKGSTWHGLMEKKVIEPDAGEDYLIVSGDANVVLAGLIERMGLSGLFRASSDISGLNINNYSMHRYVKGYTGIKKMLATVNGKLKFRFAEGFVVVSAERLVDYSQDDEFDSDQIDFVIEKKFKPTNHMICLGKGELKDRTVIHLYADAKGNITHTQTLFGLDERTDIYDNANVESEEELEKGGIEALQAAWNEGELQLNLDSTSSYDIGDIVGAREIITGITMARPIVQKIVTIEKDIVKITHKVGE
jgi:hypothetical protein